MVFVEGDMEGDSRTPIESGSRKKRHLSDLNISANKENISGSVVALVPPVVTPVAMKHDVLVISLDGNIGAGKSTLLEAIRVAIPEVDVVVEPVGEWEKLKTKDGKSLLAHFYDDSQRWGYTFQNCAILTRIIALKEAIRNTKKRVLITERSVMTDRYVFAEMNRDCGNINELEWDLYMKWFDNFAADLPVKGVIHVTTTVNTSADRIVKRGREGEGGIPRDYLQSLDAQHHKWLSNTGLPVLRLSTETSVSAEENIDKVREFVNAFLDEQNAESTAQCMASTPAAEPKKYFKAHHHTVDQLDSSAGRDVQAAVTAM